jgi:hypothetical protein
VKNHRNRGISDGETRIHSIEKRFDFFMAEC